MLISCLNYTNNCFTIYKIILPLGKILQEKLFISFKPLAPA